MGGDPLLVVAGADPNGIQDSGFIIKAGKHYYKFFGLRESKGE